MKLKIAFVACMLITISTQGQNIENPSFDSVYIGGIDRIYSWVTSDSWPIVGDTVFPLEPDSHYTGFNSQFHMAFRSSQIEYSGAFAGPYAVKLVSEPNRINKFGISFQGFVVNGEHFYTDSSGYLDLKRCGTPFPYRPVKFRGHYKLIDNSPSLSNYPMAVVLLKKYNPATQLSDTIGLATATMQLSPISTWTLFEMPINYFSNQIPDSIVVAFFSPPLGFASTLWVDSLGFDYSTSTNINESKLNENIFYQDRMENKIHFLKDDPKHSIEIYDVNGKLLFEEISPVNSIDISGLANGNYFMSIKYMNNMSIVFKIVK